MWIYFTDTGSYYNLDSAIRVTDRGAKGFTILFANNISLDLYHPKDQELIEKIKRALTLKRI